MTTVKLNDGKTMPILGFGTARLFGEKGKKGIITAYKWYTSFRIVQKYMETKY